jgi:hypothetical protein
MAKRAAATRKSAGSRTIGKRRITFFVLKREMKKKLASVDKALKRDDLTPRAARELRNAREALNTVLTSHPWCPQPMFIDF